MRRWIWTTIVLLLAAAFPARAADWQAWLGVGGGRGGVYEFADGALVAVDFGLRWNRNSLMLSDVVSVTSSTSYDPVSEVALLAGRMLGSGDLRLELQLGVSLIGKEVPLHSGIVFGLHGIWAFSKYAGLGLRSIRSFNDLDNYSGLVLQLELGKLR